MDLITLLQTAKEQGAVWTAGTPGLISFWKADEEGIITEYAMADLKEGEWRLSPWEPTKRRHPLSFFVSIGDALANPGRLQQG